MKTYTEAEVQHLLLKGQANAIELVETSQARDLDANTIAVLLEKVESLEKRNATLQSRNLKFIRKMKNQRNALDHSINTIMTLADENDELTTRLHAYVRKSYNLHPEHPGVQ